MEWISKVARNKVLAAALSMSAVAALAQENPDDLSVEELYEKAGQLFMFGNHAEASKMYELMIEKSNGQETLFEDFGSQAGGIFFDYGMTLMPQKRWEDARVAFDICVRSDEIAEEVESPINSQNPRRNLAKFQLGFCEAQFGNYEEAIKLYDEYIASDPTPNEWQQVYASFKLRYGGALMKVGRAPEGVAVIQELFDAREERNISPSFLMQGILDLGLSWVELANKAATDAVEVEKIEGQLHEFLDKNEGVIKMSPMDQFRFGFLERLRMLGFECSKAAMYTASLRFFALAPTFEDVRNDIDLNLARQPIGTEVPSQFQQLIDRLTQMEDVELHPDAESLRVVANSYTALENVRAARAVYWFLVEKYPSGPQDARAEILHEAARLSSMLADYPAAQYFGEKFMAEMPEDHELRNNVSSFMLQSLFTAKQYDQVIKISETVRERYEAGVKQRELADFFYPMSLYITKRFDEAVEPFSEYVKHYPEGEYLEGIMFHRSSNLLVTGKTREAAEKYEEFLVKFPDSKSYLDTAISDLTIARFNLEDYPAAIAASERLLSERPDSIQVGRTLNITGDAYLIQAGSLGKDQMDEEPELRAKALDCYLRGIDASKAKQASDESRVDYHRQIASESIWKAADIYYTDGEIDKGIGMYDDFFPDYAGTTWEPQISIFSLEHLEGADRGEEGLTQVEKMILLLGNQPPQNQDITMLRKAIGSYAEASTRVRGVEDTVATLGNFPDADPSNQGLLTWLKIQQVIVLQEYRKGMEKNSSDYASVETQIDAIFEELKLFEKRDLSEFVLREIGRYFAGTDNPFRAVPYFEELLARTNPESEEFKLLAEMELGIIEMRASDPAKVQTARERFRRIIDSGKDKALVPQAWLNLALLYIRNKDWKDALAALDTINKEKKYFQDDKAKRAEAGFLLGTVYDELDDPAAANQAYLAVVSTYGKFGDWVTQAWERYIPNSLADFEMMPVDTEEARAAKRGREIALYRLTRKFLYQWQNWTDEETPSGALRRLRRQIEDMKTDMGISPEEEAQVMSDLGLGPQ